VIFPPTKKLHLGLTYKCTLACLECCRTNTRRDQIPHITEESHLKWEQYKDLLQRQYKHIEMCGNWGDPIYYPDLIQLVNYIHEVQDDCYISLHTNGSYVKPNTWQRLAEAMSKKDELIFSLDGTKDTNHKYRINSDWKSIAAGVNTVFNYKHRPLLTQKTLLFSYVEQDMKNVIHQAMNMGFDRIRFDYPITSEKTADLKPTRTVEENILEMSKYVTPTRIRRLGASFPVVYVYFRSENVFKD